MTLVAIKNDEAIGMASLRINDGIRADLVMFYCTSFLKDHVYYIEPDIIAIAKFMDHQLHLLDVFGKVTVDLEKVIESLAHSQIKEVILGFTPENTLSFETREINGDDTLFIQKDKTKLFLDNKIMFPILSHA